MYVCIYIYIYIPKTVYMYMFIIDIKNRLFINLQTNSS